MGWPNAEELETGSLFPRVHEIRRVSARIAEAVVGTARDQGVGRAITDADIPRMVAAAMWEPNYLPMSTAAVRRQSSETVLV